MLRPWVVWFQCAFWLVGRGRWGSCIVAYQSPLLERGFYPKAEVSTQYCGAGINTERKSLTVCAFEACLSGCFSVMTVAFGILSFLWNQMNNVLCPLHFKLYPAPWCSCHPGFQSEVLGRQPSVPRQTLQGRSLLPCFAPDLGWCSWESPSWTPLP